MNSTPESIISASERLNRFIQSNSSAINDVADINQKTHSSSSNKLQEEPTLFVEFNYSNRGTDKFYPNRQLIRERAAENWFSVTSSENLSQRNDNDLEILQELEIAVKKDGRWVLADDLQKAPESTITSSKADNISENQNVEKALPKNDEGNTLFNKRNDLREAIVRIYSTRDQGSLDRTLNDILIQRFNIKKAPQEILSRLNKLGTENPKSVSQNMDKNVVSPGLIAAILLDEAIRADSNDIIQNQSAKDKLIYGKIDKDTQIKAGEFLIFSKDKELSNTSIGLGQIKPITYIELVQKGYLAEPDGWKENEYEAATREILDKKKNPEIVAAVLLRAYNYRVIDLPGLPQDETYKALNDPNKEIKEKRQIVASLYSQGMSANPSTDERYANIASASVAFDGYFKTV